MGITSIGSVPLASAGFGGPLIAQWVDDFPRVRAFFRRDPRLAADWTSLFEELAAHPYPRAELAEVLVRSAAAMHAPAAVLAQAAAFRAPNTLAVITGQQPGLFGGPLYNLYKALTAIKWARELAKKFGSTWNFVPVFWVASDDHDLGEIDHAYFLDAGSKLRLLRTELGETARGAAAADVSAREGLEALRKALAEVLPAAAPDLLAPYFTANLGAAFARLLTRWLGPLGLVVVEAPAIRPFGRSHFARELEEYPKTCGLLRASARALQTAGYEPEFSEAKDSPHLFLTAHGIRARLEPAPDSGGAAFVERSAAFHSRGLEPATHARTALQALLTAHPERFSASAAFRPVLQNLTFPVAAAVLGPGELAYWAQLAGIHDHFGAVWPMLVPRLSATLLDAPAQKDLRKLGASVEDLFLPREDLKRKLLSGGDADAVLEAGSASILAELGKLFDRIRELDRGLDPLFEKARERIAHELDRIAEKTKASLAQKDGAGLARLEHLASLARPKGKPQERILSTAQFLARHPNLAGELLDALDPLDFRHQVWRVE